MSRAISKIAELAGGIAYQFGPEVVHQAAEGRLRASPDGGHQGFQMSLVGRGAEVVLGGHAQWVGLSL